MPSNTENPRQLAQTWGGSYLGTSSTKSSRPKLVWRCAEGHTWEARLDSIRRGTWCPQCSRNGQKNTIEEMRLIAKRRGGECLSPIYTNAHTKLDWRCVNGHAFEATPAHVKRGRWCHQCGIQSVAKQISLSISEIRQIAKFRNGRCLSDTYTPNEKLEWRCEKGHVWKALVHNVKRGSWCPICGHRRSGRKHLSLEEMRQQAASHGGTCLSPKYTNTDTKIHWRCKKGHTWWALPSSVKKNHWCPKCAGVYPLSLRHAQSLARDRGGKCLSRRYRSSHSKLKWQCAEGHTWMATYSNVNWGRWCPECSSGLGERICRAYFEQIFNQKFPKSRPPWLVNQDGYQMELDGYCEVLGLAFEHQGLQHFRQVNNFYYPIGQFKKRKRDDRRKKTICKQHGITLIEVPQIPDSLPLLQVQPYILRQCREKGYGVPLNANHVEINLRSAYSPNIRERLRVIREIASAHGGRCLSSGYLSKRGRLRFSCRDGHEWETESYVILKGHWCPRCAATERGRTRRLTLQEMRKIAAEKGGRCLSNEYINANTHLLWECSKGHRWKAIPNSIKQGSWCSICSRIQAATADR